VVEQSPHFLRACGSVVERTPDKGEVEGSIPSTPNSKKWGEGRRFDSYHAHKGRGVDSEDNFL
jgi:hypothetical protein